MKIESDRVYLRPVTIADVSDAYVGWMNDPEVMKFLEARFRSQTRETILEYVKMIAADETYRFFAIIAKPEECHIGNVKLTINRFHGFADVAYMIGEKKYWGKGYASEAVRAACVHAFDTLGLKKVVAGAYAANTGSIRVLEKIGFTEEGRWRHQVLCDNEYDDHVIFGLFPNELKELRYS